MGPDREGVRRQGRRLTRPTLLAVAIMLCAGGALAQSQIPLDVALERFNAARKTAPRDVAAYMDRHEACWHFAGEDAYDAARRAEINRALDELNCSNLKDDQALLRGKYAGSPAALAAIDAAAALD